jgi:hypothetical protein
VKKPDHRSSRVSEVRFNWGNPFTSSPYKDTTNPLEVSKSVVPLSRSHVGQKYIRSRCPGGGTPRFEASTVSPVGASLLLAINLCPSQHAHRQKPLNPLPRLDGNMQLIQRATERGHEAMQVLIGVGFNRRKQIGGHECRTGCMRF